MKAKVRWPDLHTSPNTWSIAEVRAVCINPVATGIGRHPRSICDEDWVLSCERDVEDNGLAQFLTDLLHVLRLTIPSIWANRNPSPNIRSAGQREKSRCPTSRIRVIEITRTSGTRAWSVGFYVIQCLPEFHHSIPLSMSRHGSQPVSGWWPAWACGNISWMFYTN